MFMFHVCTWDLLSRKALPWDFISAEPPSLVKINLKETVLSCWRSKVGETTDLLIGGGKQTCR